MDGREVLPQGRRAAGGDLALSVVIPVFRNAATLGKLHERLTDSLRIFRGDYELLFVNDACPAGSLAVLRDLATDPAVEVIDLPGNIGQHAAILAGMRQARGTRVVVMDADLQDPPEVIPDLLGRLDAGYDAVFAGRRGEYEPSLRLLTSRLFKALLGWATGLPADAGAFVALNRRTAAAVLAFRARVPFIPSLVGLAARRVTSVPVVRSKRSTGSSAYSGLQRLRLGTLALSWAIAWRFLPPTRRWLRHPERASSMELNTDDGDSRVGASRQDG